MAIRKYLIYDFKNPYYTSDAIRYLDRKVKKVFQTLFDPFGFSTQQTDPDLSSYCMDMRELFLWDQNNFVVIHRHKY